MVTQEVHDLSALTSTGTCVVVEGLVEKTPEGVKQPIELKATKIKYVGACDAATYPIAKVRE
jgi:asparaginyl-tRNA synthetase